MIADDREVAGLRCSEVLGLLSDFMDDELEFGLEQRVRAHVTGCDTCARFGSAFATVVARLREGLGPDSIPADVAQRLQTRLGQDA